MAIQQSPLTGPGFGRVLFSILSVSALISISICDASYPREQKPLLSFDSHYLNEQGHVKLGEAFSLRDIFHHGTYQHPNLHKHISIPKSEDSSWVENSELPGLNGPLIARSRPMEIERLKDRRPSIIEPMVAAAQEDGKFWSNSDPAAWTIDHLIGPDVTDKETILTLARMSANSYQPKPGQGDWTDVGSGFNESADFGWENDGIRGYIYANQDASIVTISFKGGTPQLGWMGGHTSSNDRDNVNHLFSCCCGQGSFLAHKVCSCATFGFFGWACNLSCVGECLKAEERYYPAAQHIYSNVSAFYPNAEIWVTGHSLGGTLSSLLGLTYGLTAVTIETPPEALPAGRLGLPAPPGSGTMQTRNNTGAYHFGITSDPIYMGKCKGPAASCALAGYAFDSVCHTGMKCVYDVVKDFGWWSSISTHGIVTVIQDVIMKYESVPVCEPAPECQDCSNWKELHGSPTTSKTSKPTTTCHSPGWFGCRDKTTAGISTSSSKIPTTTSASCKSPGWFSCHDKPTTTAETPKPTDATVPRKTNS